MDTEIERLKDRIEELERLLGMRLRAPRIPGLNESQWQLLGLLLRGGVIEREYAFIALYGDRHEAEQPTNLRMVDVNVSRINRVLMKRYGIRISTEPRTGYYIDERSRQILNDLVRTTANSDRTSDRPVGRTGDSKSVPAENWTEDRRDRAMADHSLLDVATGYLARSRRSTSHKTVARSGRGADG